MSEATMSQSTKRRPTGALGMQEGDRIRHEPDGRCGVAGEFLQGGDVCVTWDDGTTGQVMWNNCGLVERAFAPPPGKRWRVSLVGFIGQPHPSSPCPQFSL